MPWRDPGGISVRIAKQEKAAWTTPNSPTIANPNGACCVHLGPYDGNGYVYLDRQEAARMRRHGLRVIEAALGAKCLAAAPHEGAFGYPACVAFDGELGVRCGCSVYRDRPSVCRRFQSGSDLCREARERAGLET